MLFARTPGRRRLRFSGCPEMFADVERLARGHRTLGTWTLAQVCNHLADTQKFSVEPTEPEIKTTPLFRATVGRMALRALLWFGWIPESRFGVAGPPAVELNVALRRLRAATERISTQPMTAVHPIFGRLTQEQWRRFHLRHAAHHLSFMIPGGRADDAG